jgi:hypothetical protein
MGLTLAIGVATGCVYALVAVGYSLIYRTTGVVNFAQGGYVMIGGFATWWFFSVAALPYPLAIASGVAVATLIGLLLWTVVVLPLWRRRSPPYVVLLATIVFGAIVGNATLLLLGTLPQTLPPWVPGLAFEFEGNRIDGQYGLIIAASLLSLIAFGAVLRFSSLGRAMRACAASRDTSQLLGISPERIGALSFAATAALGGVRRRHDHTGAVHLVRSRARFRRLRICCGSARRIREPARSTGWRTAARRGQRAGRSLRFVQLPDGDRVRHPASSACRASTRDRRQALGGDLITLVA